MTTKTPAPRIRFHRPLRTLALCTWLAAGAVARAADPGIEVIDAWARATPPGVETGAAYCRIVNSGAADRLIGARSSAARTVELHTTTDSRGVAEMARATEIPIGATATVTLAPGGTHMMLVGIAAPLVAGTPIEITLVFANAGEIDVAVPVIDSRAAPPPPEHEHHAH